MKNLKDTELETRLRNLTGKEREVLAEIVLHVMEVDRRKLYLRRAKRSLFAYLTEELGYAESTAQRKIDAARLAAELPELIGMLRAGEICLGRIGALRRGIRDKQKRCSVTDSMKREALALVKAAPAKQADRIVAAYFEMPVIRRTHTQAQADASMRLAMTIPAEVWKMLERCRDLLAHKVPDGQWPEIMAELCAYFLKMKDPELRAATSESEVKPKERADGPIPPKLRRYVFQRDRSCRYKDPETGRVCGSTFNLEVDHIRMRCRGGTNEPANLRLLCRAHNQLAAEDALGKSRPVRPGRDGPCGKTRPAGDPSP